MSIIHPREIEKLGDPVTVTSNSTRRVSLDLSEDFDIDLSELMLNSEVFSTPRLTNFIYKSMYEFNLDSVEGVSRLLSLLPILDPEIVKTVLQEIWPNYNLEEDNFDAKIAKAEVRGYLLDLLEEVESATVFPEDSTAGSPEVPLDTEESPPLNAEEV